MKLLTCKKDDRMFAAVSDGVKVYEAAKDMYELIEMLKTVSAESLMCGEAMNLADVKLMSPIYEPHQDIICLGMNYNEHGVEAAKWGESFIRNEGKAVYFGKRAAYIAGPDDDVDGHFDIVTELDYEVELGVILSNDAYNVSYEDAYDYVLGYTVINDWSARNLQRDHKQYYFGKSLDTHTSMGPWIVTKDELSADVDFAIRCYINGELRQDSNTNCMIFDIPHVISELSKGMTLKAGAIIASGTPAGVGMGFEPPKYLNAGDIVRCEIDGVGILENKIK